MPARLLLILIVFFLQLENGFTQTLESILTPGEIQWLQENEIRYAPNPSWAPGDFINEEGVHQGIVADYIQIFESRLGTSFTDVSFNSWNAILEGLQNSEVDFVGAIQVTGERESYLNFTEPFMNVPIGILTRNDYPFVVTPDHVNEMEIAGVEGYTSVEFLAETYPRVNLVEFENDLAALLQVTYGNIDGVVIDLMTASYLVEKYGITNLQLGRTLDFEWELRFASRKDLPEIHSILNKLLTTIDEDQRHQIYNNWVNIEGIQEAGFFERNQTRLMFLGVFILFVVTSVSLHNYDLSKQVKTQTRKLEQELKEKLKIETDLRSSLKEREILIAEIYHRVKNNLAVISGFLQIELMESDDEKVHNILSNSVYRIKSMALIHQNLYEAKDFKNIEFRVFTNDLVRFLEEKYNSDEKVQVHKELDDVKLNINLAIPAALLVNELLTNAFKHAFPDQRKGTISIRIKEQAGMITITIKDNGIGLPENFDIGDRSSVGYTLTNALSKQLHADYNVETRPGTCFTFVFKNSDKKGPGANIHPKE
ncbi:MAG: transporter substrate-binding domain-containing protein [Balneolaceae bacterium]